MITEKPGDKVALEAVEMLKAMRAEIERLRSENDELMIENGELANTLGKDVLRLTALNAELMAALEQCRSYLESETGMTIKHPILKSARAALAKVKEGK